MSGCWTATSPPASTKSRTRRSWTGCGERIADRRVLGLVKAFLKAGILTQDGAVRDTVTGTPQGGILSPLLSNLALSALDEHIVERGQASAPSWVRERRRRHGLPNYRIVR